MSPDEIDKAIEALPDHEIEELYDASTRRWSVRVQHWAIPIAVLAVMLAMFFAMRELVQSYWPGSLVAGVLLTLAWCATFLGLLRFALSMRVAMWRTARAGRREYRRRYGAA